MNMIIFLILLTSSTIQVDSLKVKGMRTVGQIPTKK